MVGLPAPMSQATERTPNTMTSEVALPEGSAYAMLKAAGSFNERTAASRYAIETVPVPEFRHPVPRFFFDLPWGNEDDNVVEEILVQLAASEDIETATQVRELTEPYDILGHKVVVHGIQARRSDLKDATWGAYLVLTCTVDDGAPEVITTGSAEICVVMWRLYCEGRFPAQGIFDVKGREVPGRKQPLTFRLESEL